MIEVKSNVSRLIESRARATYTALGPKRHLLINVYGTSVDPGKYINSIFSDIRKVN